MLMIMATTGCFFRAERGMSQDELADKIMVTRQAVSRWENGDTVPNTDTLKLLSKEFDVSINMLLGEPRKLICQCCGMPIEDDSVLGRDKDGTLNEEYCKWCYADGTYTYNDMDELIDVCVKNVVVTTLKLVNVPTEPKLPQTGDNANPLLYLGIGALALITGVGVGLRGRKKKNK